MWRGLVAAALLIGACATPKGSWFKPGGAFDSNERGAAVASCRVESNKIRASCWRGWLACAQIENDTFKSCMRGKGWFWDPNAGGSDE